MSEFIQLQFNNLTLITAAVYAAFLILSLRLTFPMYVAFRKRKSGFGTIFNSVTEKPEALATISLKNVHGLVVRTTVSDAEGRYRLIAPRGEYTIEVSKHGFSFPSRNVTKEKNPSVYDNILSTKRINIKDFGAMTKNIPIDPGAERGSGFFSLRLNLNKNEMNILLLLSLAVSVTILYILWQSILIWLIFVIYVAILAGRFLTFKPPQPPFGTIRDESNKRPIEKVVVRIFETRFNKLLETQITSAKGRYAFIVQRGSYRIMFRQDGYKTVIMNYPAIKEDGTLIAHDIKMKKAEKQSAE
ncbi:MAG: carboxypeptidase-like regulatory domain-containing protein [Patescibacteria group bacterium]|nr:carboxypeptidase-like regulatory domain-containing protein [Patescibacteria group bacterium]